MPLGVCVCVRLYKDNGNKLLHSLYTSSCRPTLRQWKKYSMIFYAASVWPYLGLSLVLVRVSIVCVVHKTWRQSYKNDPIYSAGARALYSAGAPAL